jgi:hypothetical protein
MTPDLDNIKSLLVDATLRNETIRTFHANDITYLYNVSARGGAHLLFACVNKSRSRKRWKPFTPAEAFEFIEQNWSKRADETTRKAVIREAKKRKSR